MRSGGPGDPVEEITIEPTVCVERILPKCLRALEALLEAVDWSRLPGAAEGFMPLGDSQPVDSDLRLRISLLGGVG
jgi:hypothetical protein